MGVYSELRRFTIAHRVWRAGRRRGPITPEGYRLWAHCSCGARLERWVTPADAEGLTLRRP
jgi:hypothetical protein